MPQPRWKMVIANLGTQTDVLDAYVSADNWLAALRAGRDQLGDPGGVPPGASCRVGGTGEVTILDATHRRRYTLTPAPPLEASSVPPARVPSPPPVEPSQGPPDSPSSAHGANAADESADPPQHHDHATGDTSSAFADGSPSTPPPGLGAGHSGELRPGADPGGSEGEPASPSQAHAPSEPASDALADGVPSMMPPAPLPPHASELPPSAHAGEPATTPWGHAASELPVSASPDVATTAAPPHELPPSAASELHPSASGLTMGDPASTAWQSPSRTAAAELSANLLPDRGTSEPSASADDAAGEPSPDEATSARSDERRIASEPRAHAGRSLLIMPEPWPPEDEEPAEHSLEEHGTEAHGTEAHGTEEHGTEEDRASARQQQTRAYSAERADALRREYESSLARLPALTNEGEPTSQSPVRALPPATRSPITRAPSSAPTSSSTPSSSAAEARLIPAFARNVEPTPGSPITYRERAYLVTPANDLDDLESLLQAELLELRGELRGAPRGQLVHLAVFDKPERRTPHEPPVATLEWSDWRGNAVFVSHAEGPPTTTLHNESPPEPPRTAEAPPTPASQVPYAPSSLDPATTTADEPAPTPSSEPAEHASPANEPHADNTDASPPRVAEVPTDDPPLVDSSPPPGHEPAAAAAVREAAVPRLETKAARADAGEADIRLAQAFEALPDLYFLPTPVAGMEFANRLIARMVPCAAISTCLYDINTDEFRFVAVAGPGADARRASAVSSQSGLFGAAKWTRKDALIVADVRSDPRYQPAIDGRAELEPRDLAYVPLRSGAQLLGMVQLINRAHEHGFTASDVAVLHYIANQLAAFLIERRNLR